MQPAASSSQQHEHKHTTKHDIYIYNTHACTNCHLCTGAIYEPRDAAGERLNGGSEFGRYNSIYKPTPPQIETDSRAFRSFVQLPTIKHSLF